MAAPRQQSWRWRPLRMCNRVQSISNSSSLSLCFSCLLCCLAGKREARQVSFLSVFLPLPPVHLRQRCFPALSWKRSLSPSPSPSPVCVRVCLAGKLFRSFFQPERGGRVFANFAARSRRSDAQFQDSALPSSPRSGGESLTFHLKQQRAKTFPPPPLLVLL